MWAVSEGNTSVVFQPWAAGAKNVWHLLENTPPYVVCSYSKMSCHIVVTNMYKDEAFKKKNPPNGQWEASLNSYPVYLETGDWLFASQSFIWALKTLSLLIVFEDIKAFACLWLYFLVPMNFLMILRFFFFFRTATVFSAHTFWKVGASKRSQAELYGKQETHNNAKEKK